MEPQPPTTPLFKLGKQSSLAPEGGGGGVSSSSGSGTERSAAAATASGVMSFQLMYLAHGGNAEDIRELLDTGADPNFVSRRHSLHRGEGTVRCGRNRCWHFTIQTLDQKQGLVA